MIVLEIGLNILLSTAAAAAATATTTTTTTTTTILLLLGLWGYVSGGNFHRFSNVTDGPLAQPYRQAICWPLGLCKGTVKESIHQQPVVPYPW